MIIIKIGLVFIIAHLIILANNYEKERMDSEFDTIKHEVLK